MTRQLLLSLMLVWQATIGKYRLYRVAHVKWSPVRIYVSAIRFYVNVDLPPEGK